MRKGFAQLLLLIPVFVLLAATAVFFYYTQNKTSKTQASNADSQITLTSKPSPQASPLSVTINGELLPGLITDEPNAVFSIQTENGLFKLRVPLREIPGRTCESESPWPKENSKVIARGVLTGEKEITCEANGDYFKTDETANWKTFSANTAEDTLNGAKPATVRYSYKHPAGWVTYSGEYSYNIAVSSNKDYVIGYPTKPGEINLFANNYLNNTDIPPKGKEETTLGGKPATKDITNFSDTNEIIKNVAYIAESIPTQEGNIIAGFRLSCVYYGSTDNINKNLEKTCDLIASTFKFTN